MPTRLISPRKRGVNDKRLTAGQMLFVKAMKADPLMNPANAARAAGYKTPNQAANKLMKDPLVMAVLGKELHQRAEKFEIRADEVLQELHHLAMARGEDLFDEKGQLIPISEMPERARAAIKSFKVIKKETKGPKGTTVSTAISDVVLCDKVEAIDMLMKHLGQYEKDNGQKPGLTFDLSHLYVRPQVVDPVKALTGEETTILEVAPEPPKVEYKIDEFEGEEE